ncbi:hypothetical protein Q8F55_008931 [Vanrija albida]|uniref:Uncharacterized protein n=1 Tax=Vanrija albida TaxID=181172 RepID=A0ABR3PS96_9TREE
MPPHHARSDQLRPCPRLPPFVLWIAPLLLVFLLYAADTSDHGVATRARIVEEPQGQCPAPAPRTELVPELAPGAAFIHKFSDLGPPANDAIAARYRGIARAGLLRAKDDLLWAERLLAAHRAMTPLPGPCRGARPAQADCAWLRAQAVFDVDSMSREDRATFPGPPYVLAPDGEAVRASMCRRSLFEAERLVADVREAHRVAAARFILHENLVRSPAGLSPYSDLNVDAEFDRARDRLEFAIAILQVVDLAGTSVEIKAAGRGVVHAWRAGDSVLATAMGQLTADGVQFPLDKSVAYLPLDGDDAIRLMNQAKAAYERARADELAHQRMWRTSATLPSVASALDRYDYYRLDCTFGC